jgi:hypothetical protein
MHTLTDAIEQHSEAIKQRLDDSAARLDHHLARTTRGFILRMTLIVGTALIVAFVAYKLS